MNGLTIIKKNGGAYIDSREVAGVIGKQHKNLLRDIGVYIDYMKKSNGLKIEPVDFFVESTYTDAKGETRPCYLISKMGCELVANKLTGEKGVLFTAAYVAKFNEMEVVDRAAVAALRSPRLGEYNAASRIIVSGLKNVGANAEQILEFLKSVYVPLGFEVAISLTNMPKLYTAKEIAEMYGVYSQSGNPHSQAVSCVLNDHLNIGDDHKAVISMDYGSHSGMSVRYDSYAVDKFGDWLVNLGYPAEISGDGRTYYIQYVGYDDLNLNG